MVEMLGVLAIIGVLSVGAIAGFHKAMFKYKLNKQAEQLNTVFHAVARYTSSFNNLVSNASTFTYLIQLDEIPKEMIQSTTTQSIYDVFGTKLVSNIQPPTSSSGIKNIIVVYMYPSLKEKSTDNLEICLNIYKTFKENSQNIYRLYSMTGYNTSDQKVANAYGDEACTTSRTCLKDMTVEMMREQCSTHIGASGSGAHIAVLWKLQP